MQHSYTHSYTHSFHVSSAAVWAEDEQAFFVFAAMAARQPGSGAGASAGRKRKAASLLQLAEACQNQADKAAEARFERDLQELVQLLRGPKKLMLLSCLSFVQRDGLVPSTLDVFPKCVRPVAQRL